MKYLLLALALILTNLSKAQTQQKKLFIGTEKTFISFPGNIVSLNGDNEAYVFTRDGVATNTLHVEHLNYQPTKDTTSLLVIYENSKGKRFTKLFQLIPDFSRKSELYEIEKEFYGSVKIEGEGTNSLPHNFLKEIKKKAYFTGVYTKKHKLYMYVDGVFAHDETIIVLLKIKNNSSITYHVDLITLNFIFKESRGIRKTEQQNEVASIISKFETEKISAKSIEYFAYVIEKRGTGVGDGLEILLREKEGNREIRLVVPSSDLLNSKILHFD